MPAKERCQKCGRVLPVGQLRRTDGGVYECLKEAACAKAQQRAASASPTSTPPGEDEPCLPK